MAQLIVAGNATPSQVLTGNTFSAGSQTGVSGTMPNNGAVTITPSASSQVIPAGYHNGSGSIPAVVVTAANVLTGTTIAGTSGTMPNRGAVTITPSTTSQAIAVGYHNGSGSVAGDANLVASKILIGETIFGVTGSGGKRYASGGATSSSATLPFVKSNGTSFSRYYIEVSGLTFRPSIIIFRTGNNMSLFSDKLSLQWGTAAYIEMDGDPNYYMQLDGTYAFSNVGGFRMPTSYDSMGYNWFAWE